MSMNAKTTREILHKEFVIGVGFEGYMQQKWVSSEQVEVVKTLLEELIWLRKYSDPQTNSDALTEDLRIEQIENQLISFMGLEFTQYINKKSASVLRKETEKQPCTP